MLTPAAKPAIEAIASRRTWHIYRQTTPLNLDTRAESSQFRGHFLAQGALNPAMGAVFLFQGFDDPSEHAIVPPHRRAGDSGRPDLAEVCELLG